MNKQFSVLMSVYKNEKANHLKEALNSVFNNSLLPTEVVLVVDGPINEQLEDVISYFYVNKGLIVIRTGTEKNIGLGKALNLGLVACKYDIIARMDSDDICCNDRFEKQIDFIEKNQNVVLWGGAIVEFDENMEKEIGFKSVLSDYMDIKKYAKKRNPFNHMTVMFKKHEILLVGGYEHHMFMEDYNLWLRLIAKGFIVRNISDILVNVRAGDSMLARRKGIIYVRSEIQLMLHKLKLGLDNPIHALYVFVLRAVVRFLPVSMLSKIYKSIRSN